MFFCNVYKWTHSKEAKQRCGFFMMKKNTMLLYWYAFIWSKFIWSKFGGDRRDQFDDGLQGLEVCVTFVFTYTWHLKRLLWSTRWAPTSYKWSYGAPLYKWHDKWVFLGLLHPYEWTYNIYFTLLITIVTWCLPCIWCWNNWHSDIAWVLEIWWGFLVELCIGLTTGNHWESRQSPEIFVVKTLGA